MVRSSLFSFPSIFLPAAHALSLQVWDDVLPNAKQRQTLHEFASLNGLGHSCFSRPVKNVQERNVIELALDAILTEIESLDGSVQMKPHYVEYWSRQEWRHIGEFLYMKS